MKAILLNGNIYMGTVYIENPKAELVLPVSHSLGGDFINHESLTPDGEVSIKMVYKFVDAGGKYAVYELDGFRK